MVAAEEVDVDEGDVVRVLSRPGPVAGSKAQSLRTTSRTKRLMSRAALSRDSLDIVDGISAFFNWNCKVWGRYGRKPQMEALKILWGPGLHRDLRRFRSTVSSNNENEMRVTQRKMRILEYRDKKKEKKRKWRRGRIE